MSSIELYTRQDCLFCHIAKELLREKGQKFAEIDVDERPADRQGSLWRCKALPNQIQKEAL